MPPKGSGALRPERPLLPRGWGVESRGRGGGSPAPLLSFNPRPGVKRVCLPFRGAALTAPFPPGRACAPPRGEKPRRTQRSSSKAGAPFPLRVDRQRKRSPPSCTYTHNCAPSPKEGTAAASRRRSQRRRCRNKVDARLPAQASCGSVGKRGGGGTDPRSSAPLPLPRHAQRRPLRQGRRRRGEPRRPRGIIGELIVKKRKAEEENISWQDGRLGGCARRCELLNGYGEK